MRVLLLRWWTQTSQSAFWCQCQLLCFVCTWIQVSYFAPLFSLCLRCWGVGGHLVLSELIVVDWSWLCSMDADLAVSPFSVCLSSCALIHLSLISHLPSSVKPIFSFQSSFCMSVFDARTHFSSACFPSALLHTPRSSSLLSNFP